jgi:hypothetical protein
MTTLCRMFCPEDLERDISLLNKASENSTNHPRNLSVGGENDDDEGEEEEEEEEEEEREGHRDSSLPYAATNKRDPKLVRS